MAPQGIGEMVLSDDGSLALWTRSGAQTVGEEDAAERKPVAHVFMARLDAETVEPVQLTRGVERASGLALSPDGQHLAFLVEREQPGKPKVKGPQVWILPLGGGEAWPLTHYPRGVSGASWLNDKEMLIQRPEDPDAREKRLKKTKDTAVAVEDVRDAPPVRLFVASLDGESKRLTDNDDWIDAAMKP
ncbi:MAG: hypothetical protein AAFY88_07360 [Acidobacteriota bacterium]